MRGSGGGAAACRVVYSSRAAVAPGRRLSSSAAAAAAAGGGYAAEPSASSRRRVGVSSLRRLAAEGSPIVVLTAYDAPTAAAASAAGADVLLVGDSAGMVVHGLPDTTRVTLDAMVLHAAAVARGSSGRPMLVGDLPFGSYATPDAAVAAGARFVAAGRAHAVKLEGGRAQAPKTRALVGEGIPVMGHVGLLPQTALLAEGGYATTGASARAAMAVVDDALACADAGAFALVLELVPAQLARYVTALLGPGVPTIGIGSGARTAGQVLVAHDVLGLGRVGRAAARAPPFFVREYAALGSDMTAAFAAYARDVRSGAFPGGAGGARAGAGAGAAGASGDDDDAAGSHLPPAPRALRSERPASHAEGAAALRRQHHRDMAPAEFAAFAAAARRAHGGNERAMRALDEAGEELAAAAAAAADAAAAAAANAAAAAEAARAAVSAPQPTPGGRPAPLFFAGAAGSGGGARGPGSGGDGRSPLPPPESLAVAVLGTGAAASALVAALAANPALSCVHVYGRWAARVRALNARGLAVRPLGAGAPLVVVPFDSTDRAAAAAASRGAVFPPAPASLAAFCLDDLSAFEALRSRLPAGLSPPPAAPRGGAAPAPASASSPAPTRRYDVVLLAGKAGDVIEQAAAAALLVRGTGAEGEAASEEGGAAAADDVRAPRRGRPGVVLPLYNGAFTAEYVLAALSELQAAATAELAVAAAAKTGEGAAAAEEAGATLSTGAAEAAAPASAAAASAARTDEPAGAYASHAPPAPAAPARAPAPWATALGPSALAHLASLRPLGQVGYGLSYVASALEPAGAPDAAVALTGVGAVAAFAGPLFPPPSPIAPGGRARAPFPAGALPLPPEHALRAPAVLPAVLAGAVLPAGPFAPAGGAAGAAAGAAWNAHRWAKLAINAVLNPTVALLGVPNGGFLPRAAEARARLAARAKAAGGEGAAARPLSAAGERPDQSEGEGEGEGEGGVGALAREALAAALASAGVPAPVAAPAAAAAAAAVTATAASGAPRRALPVAGWEGVRDEGGLLGLAEAAAGASAGNTNSMLADARAGRPGEGDFICGAVVRAAGGPLRAPATAGALAALRARDAFTAGPRRAAEAEARAIHVIAVADAWDAARAAA